MRQKVKTHTIRANPNNPRIIKNNKFRKLVESVKQFPEMLKLRPIVVDEDMMVLGGNMRLKACIEAGHKEIYIDIADGLTKEQKEEFIIKDNVGFGDWEWDILANEWDSVKLQEWGLDVWDNIDDKDIEESESSNFVIRCENIEELQDMQKTFKVKGKKINYENFIDIYGQK